MEKLAVITSAEVGKPTFPALEGLLDIAYSIDSSVADVLNGASMVFLWDVSLAGELGESWEKAGCSAGWLHVAVTGIDGLCTEQLRKAGTVLTNSAGIYDDAIAEYVLAACLGYERKLALLRDQQREHRWSWLQGGLLKGGNVLVVGPGRIGRACARLFRALGCNVAALGTRSKPCDELFDFIDSSASIAKRIGWADHIVVTAPLTKETYHLIGADALASCKISAHLVNVGRGAIVDTAALEQALADGLLGGVTLDVLEEEPLKSDSPLWGMDNVVITPHIAGDAGDFEQFLIRQFESNALKWLAGEPLDGTVDLGRGY